MFRSVKCFDLFQTEASWWQGYFQFPSICLWCVRPSMVSNFLSCLGFCNWLNTETKKFGRSPLQHSTRKLEWKWILSWITGSRHGTQSSQRHRREKCKANPWVQLNPDNWRRSETVLIGFKLLMRIAINFLTRTRTHCWQVWQVPLPVLKRPLNEDKSKYFWCFPFKTSLPTQNAKFNHRL